MPSWLIFQHCRHLSGWDAVVEEARRLIVAGAQADGAGNQSGSSEVAAKKSIREY